MGHAGGVGEEHDVGDVVRVQVGAGDRRPQGHADVGPGEHVGVRTDVQHAAAVLLQHRERRRQAAPAVDAEVGAQAAGHGVVAGDGHHDLRPPGGVHE